MSLLIFLGVLFVLVFVHELGHFMIAKWTGMRVDEFGIGFPPKVFGIQRGETLYSINLLPIGGFVKIYGEDSVGVEGGDMGNRSFTSKSKWAQSAVLLAGITMNILFAWLFVAIAFGIGVQTSVSEEEASPEAQLAITNVLPDGPAANASLKSGMIITSVASGENKITELAPSTFSSFVAAHSDTPITITYNYEGEMHLVQVMPTTGIIAANPEQPAIGVALVQIDTVRRGVGEAITDSFMYVLNGIREITIGISSLVFDAVRLKADFSQVAGPVGIVGLVGEASAFGISSLLIFTAFISLNLAVINVLPFPALDGGRLLFVIIEAVKGSPINPVYVSVLNTVGFVLLLALMVAVTWNDILRLI